MTPIEEVEQDLEEQETVNTPLPPEGECADDSKPESKEQQAPTYSPEFEALWVRYPKGSVKKRAYDQWKRLRPSAETVAAMHSGLDRWLVCDRWKRGVVVHAERWIRDRWWENDPPNDRPAMVAAMNGHRSNQTGQPNLTNDMIDAIIRGER